ncbi:unnamed protein product, partial [Strongylus vulgaris]
MIFMKNEPPKRGLNAPESSREQKSRKGFFLYRAPPSPNFMDASAINPNVERMSPRSQRRDQPYIISAPLQDKSALNTLNDDYRYAGAVPGYRHDPAFEGYRGAKLRREVPIQNPMYQPAPTLYDRVHIEELALSDGPQRFGGLDQSRPMWERDLYPRATSDPCANGKIGGYDLKFSRDVIREETRDDDNFRKHDRESPSYTRPSKYARERRNTLDYIQDR